MPVGGPAELPLCCFNVIFWDVHYLCENESIKKHNKPNYLLESCSDEGKMQNDKFTLLDVRNWYTKTAVNLCSTQQCPDKAESFQVSLVYSLWVLQMHHLNRQNWGWQSPHLTLRSNAPAAEVSSWVCFLSAAHRQTERRIQTTIPYPHKHLSLRAPCCRSSADLRRPAKKRPTPSTPSTVSSWLCLHYLSDENTNTRRLQCSTCGFSVASSWCLCVYILAQSLLLCWLFTVPYSSNFFF